MLRQGDILKNKYEILRLVGKGGMSRVWLAMDLDLNKQWAVKEIDKSSAAFKNTVNENKTLREIEIMKSLDHPALPRIVDVVDDEDILCVIMDYIQGETLQGVLKMYGTQPENAVVTWMLEVCDILTYLHSQDPPIIYRDIKPSNLMLNYDGHIRIIDFGIAREYRGRGDTMPLGSEGFASPEHFTKNTDERSDIYTVGSTMYNLLTGLDQTEPPYYVQPLRKVDPALSQGLEKIILKATAKDPNERYQTAAELANALESYEKLDDAYIEGLKAKLKKHKMRLAASIAAIILGIAMLSGGIIADRNSYADLVESPGGSLAAKEESLAKAIGIDPRREDAYTALIEAYAEDGKFTEDESVRFINIYNRKKPQVPANVNYSIGEAYLRYYTGKSDSSARAKLLTAEPFFLSADGCSESKKAAGYVYLASCYRNYVLSDDSLLTGSVGKEDLENMLDEGISAVKNAENEKLRAIISEAVLNLIELEKTEIRNAGISESEVLNAIQEISGSLEDEEIIALAEKTGKSISASYKAGRKKSDKPGTEENGND